MNILNSIDLYDTGLHSLDLCESGVLNFIVDFDPEWNKTFPVIAKGITFNHVYEISQFHFNGVSFLGELSCEVLSEDERERFETPENRDRPMLRVIIENIEGEEIVLICSDSIEFLL